MVVVIGAGPCRCQPEQAEDKHGHGHLQAALVAGTARSLGLAGLWGVGDEGLLLFHCVIQGARVEVGFGYLEMGSRPDSLDGVLNRTSEARGWSGRSLCDDGRD